MTPAQSLIDLGVKNGPNDHARTRGARLLTAEDLAGRWRVSRDHVYRLARERQLPVVNLGRYKRFTLDAIEAFEASGGCAADV